jgi:hypothetical protein
MRRTIIIFALTIITAATGNLFAGPNLVIRPDTMGYNSWLPSYVTRTDTLWLTNTGDAVLSIFSITAIPDSAVPPRPSWLTVSSSGPLTIQPADSMWVLVYSYGDPYYSGTDLLNINKGRVRIVSSTPSPRDTINCLVFLNVFSPDPNAPVVDTLHTNCLRLRVNSIGNMGSYFDSGVSMDYFGPADCDTGSNSRGDSRYYLGSGSPMIIRHNNSSTYTGTWSIFNQQEHLFQRDKSGTPSSATSTSSYESFCTGTMLTIDSLVKVEMTWYAPKSPDSCNFIVEKMLVFPANIGAPVTNLQIGQAIDFDIPTDSMGSKNVSGFDSSRRLVWLRGFNSADTMTDCADNSMRYGGTAKLTSFFKSRVGCLTDSLPGGGTFAQDIYVHPSGGLRADSMWSIMNQNGYSTESRITDQTIFLTYKNGTNGFTLPANDTLTIFTALATVRTAVSTATGLDSLKLAVDKAKDFMRKDLRICYSCCIGFRGDVNGNGSIDASDLSQLVCGLVMPEFPCWPPRCFEAANVNGTGGIDASDLSSLVSYLTGGSFKLKPCP